MMVMVMVVMMPIMVMVMVMVMVVTVLSDNRWLFVAGSVGQRPRVIRP